ncbi:MAG: phosphoribosylformylglycinamidine synthase [Clostridiaceae bacterium]|nr:phosphoribosylformylglycinamidine synthase [Clostridiaceae bacterium]
MAKVFRCYTEKRQGFDIEAKGLLSRLRSEEGIDCLEKVRILNRYDCQGIDEQTYQLACEGVFSEPACDEVYHEELPFEGDWTLIVEALPGQFDMRADSCRQCIALMTRGERPLVKNAVMYVFYGNLSDEDKLKISKSLINPVESREASEKKPESLEDSYPQPEAVPYLTDLMAEADLDSYIERYGLAMDSADLDFLREYFKGEGRAPSLTELRMIDTYWSDHCRHTTFLTHLDDIKIDDEKVKAAYDSYLEGRRFVYGDKAKARPVTLMDIATAGAKVLKKQGYLANLDESEEINACSIKIKADVDGTEEPWLLMYKNETHNHPTEIEPFGGAATCLGGAIRDPLSGRAYVYQAMRVTGAGDPNTPLSETLENKLPQRTICRKAAQGYSSYGNQIGLSTGLVSELYHPGYVAKRLETGAVVAAAPESNVVRKVPEPGDVIVLLGGKTGRDGCGGATGSSKSHSSESLESCGAEVQKGNAPEERKIQRLFRNGEATRMIKRCNDFGAGGVSVAIGELADGLDIDLDMVPKKYDGLDGTELAISESQERMAVVLAPEDVEKFIALAAGENLETAIVAHVTELPRLKMRWRGEMICDISREFLNSNGAEKHASIFVPKQDIKNVELPSGDIAKAVIDRLSHESVCLQKGLGTRFDGSIGAASVLMPYGGKNQLTPTQVMAAKLPVLDGETNTASVMAYGFDPYLMEQSPFKGAMLSVVSSASKLVSAGCDPSGVYLSLQEFFEKPNHMPERMGKPFAALLGAYEAQQALKMAAIGGKDSMSGTFNDIDVPPTLISFAITTQSAGDILSPEFKEKGSHVYYFECPEDIEKVSAFLEEMYSFTQSGRVLSAWSVTAGGIIEGICKMAIGNDIGFRLDDGFDERCLFGGSFGSIIAEVDGECEGLMLGRTGGKTIELKTAEISLQTVKNVLMDTLEPIYSTKTSQQPREVPTYSHKVRPQKAMTKVAAPQAVIPVFPGTNCEYDTQKAIERAGGKGRIVLIRNMSPSALEQSANELIEALKSSQMLIIPGGFSGGDEPDGSGKFIQAFFRNPAVTEQIHELLYNRDGLALGICNGFQALVKLGLLPFGKVTRLDSTCPTVTFNTIGRHQSIYSYTRVSSVKSPWLLKCNVGEVYNIPFSHGEGRFMADSKTLKELAQNGQIAFQYCDEKGRPNMDINININGSVAAIEGITSPDGRVLGKMGHSERCGSNVAKNIPGDKYQPLFEGGVEYFR